MKIIRGSVAIPLLVVSVLTGRPDARVALAQAPSVLPLLDRYAQGNVAAVTPLAEWPDKRRVVGDIEDAARRWIGADRATSDRRRLVAATFALEIAQRWRSDADWPAARELLAWSCLELRRTPSPAPAERLWHLTAIATMQSVGDWLLLAGRLTAIGRAPGGGGSRTERELAQGHLAHATARFPTEARFALAEAMAADARHWEVGGFGGDPNLRGGLMAGEVDPSSAAQLEARDVLRLPGLLAVAERYEALTPDVDLGAEAHLRAALVRFRLAERDAALTHLRAVLEATTDTSLRHLAHLLTGAIRERQGRDADAIAAYRAALDAVPRAQAATTLLAARLLSAGRHGEAAALADTFFDGGAPPADPWLAYRWGNAELPTALLARLRAEIK